MLQGFWTAVHDFVDPLIGNATLYIQSLENQERPILNVVGHSLGGALANVFASILMVVFPHAEIHLTTFGAPRVGSPQYVKLLSEHKNMHILRIVAGVDVVTMVPTSVSVRCSC